VLDGLGLMPEDFTITNKFFGEWTFELKPEKNKQYAAVKDDIGKRIIALYNNGVIRYGEWTKDI
jgi:hypothetical protein